MAIRRTNNGIPIDMDALLAQIPENSTALGNMRVNAKGDMLDKKGNIVQKNEERVREYYKNNPRSSTARASLKGKSTLLADEPVAPVAVEPEPTEVFDEFEQPNGDIVVAPRKKK